MIRTLIAVLLVTSAFLPEVLQAQDAPYTGLESRAIKALSSEQIDEYHQGLGMGLALAAELNGYPGPKHVLEMKDELALTSAQQTNTEELFEQMHASAVTLGGAIIELEAALDALLGARSPLIGLYIRGTRNTAFDANRPTANITLAL